jgi:hypothetical protein
MASKGICSYSFVTAVGSEAICFAPFPVLGNFHFAGIPGTARYIYFTASLLDDFSLTDPWTEKACASGPEDLLVSGPPAPVSWQLPLNQRRVALP